MTNSVTGRVLANSIDSLSFKMYEENGLTETTVLADAFSVDIEIRASARVTGLPFDDGVQTRVKMRNIFGD
jgi:hypothetical protein